MSLPPRASAATTAACVLDPDPAVAALLLATGGGAQDAFADLYDLTGALVNGLAMQSTGDRVFAEELTGRVFMQVWRTSPLFDPEQASAFGWMLSILLLQQPTACP